MATITTAFNHAADTADARQPIDTTVRLITPERIVFTYPLAGPCRRALAYLIDGVLLLLVLGFLQFAAMLILVLTSGGAAQFGAAFAATFFLIWGYGAFCEGVFNGQTVGKKIVGIRVMTTQGVPITGSQAAIRNLVGTVDGPLPFLYLPGITSMILTRRFQRLGDLAAGTMVVIEEVKKEAVMFRVQTKVVEILLDHLPMRVSATPEQSRALSDYVKHRARFSDDRREEIARHMAEPIRARYALPDSSGDAVLCAFYHRLFLGE